MSVSEVEIECVPLAAVMEGERPGVERLLVEVDESTDGLGTDTAPEACEWPTISTCAV